MAFAAVFLFDGSAGAKSDGVIKSANESFMERASSKARPGDILFKSGAGLWGSLAKRLSDKDKSFGHVGVIVFSDDGRIFVVHAGGDPLSSQGKVQKSAFDVFLRETTEAALYRPKMDGAGIEKLIAFVTDATGRNAPFDRDFSLETENELYCTELVWRALTAAASEDVVPDKTKRAGRLFIAIDDLQASPWLEPVWRESVAGERPQAQK